MQQPTTEKNLSFNRLHIFVLELFSCFVWNEWWPQKYKYIQEIILRERKIIVVTHSAAVSSQTKVFEKSKQKNEKCLQKKVKISAKKIFVYFWSLALFSCLFILFKFISSFPDAVSDVFFRYRHDHHVTLFVTRITEWNENSSYLHNMMRKKKHFVVLVSII